MDIGQQFLGGTKFTELSGVGSLTTVIVRGAFLLAGISILVFFIIAGIGMIGASGEGNPQKAQQAKATITSALVGFVVVFVAYFLVKLIGQILGITIV